MNTQAINQFIHQAIPFVARSELKILEAKSGYVKLTMPFAVNTNHVGSMYAGAQFTLAEITGGILFMSTFDPKRFYPLVKEVTIRYKAPMQSDGFVEAKWSADDIANIQQALEQTGKADFTLEMPLTNQQGQTVAFAYGLYQGRTLGH